MQLLILLPVDFVSLRLYLVTRLILTPFDFVVIMEDHKMTLNRNFSVVLLIFSVENDDWVQHRFICRDSEVQLNRGVWSMTSRGTVFF